MVLKYPSDLSSRYYLALSFSDYKRPDPFTQTVQLTPAVTICLPMPAELRNRLDLNWDSTAQLDPLAEVGLNWYQNKNSEGADKAALWEAGAWALPQLLGGTISSLLTSEDQKNSGLTDKITNAFKTIGKAVAPDYLQRSGLALNPILTVQFRSPKFKIYSFSWRFSPDNYADDLNLDSIISIIDRNSKPSQVDGGAFFGYPSIASIQLVTPKSKQGLFLIQPCVITSFEVNYAPHGIPSFLAATGHATIIDVRIELLEIVLNTRSNSDSETPFAASQDGTTDTKSLEEQVIEQVRTEISGLASDVKTLATSGLTSLQGILGGK